MAATTLFLLTVLTWTVYSSRGDSTCNMTSRLDKGIASLLQGHFFDYDRKFPCDAVITAWNYCHYSTNEFSSSIILWIRFQIWRAMDGQTLQHVHTHHIRQVTDPNDDDDENRNQSFHCLRERVEIPISVQAGDFLGFPSSFAQLVPVIGQGVQGSTLYIDDGDNSEFLLRKLDSHALHVDPEIEFLPASSNTSMPPPLTTLSISPTYTAAVSKMPYSTLIFSKLPHTPAVTFSKMMPPSTVAPSMFLSIVPTHTSSLLHSTPVGFHTVETVLLLHLSSIQPSSTSELIFPASSSEVNVAVSIVSSNQHTSAVPTTTTLPSMSPPPPTATLVSDNGTLGNNLPVNKVSGTPLESETSSGKEEREPAVNWPFITGLVVGVILLVLIIIVFLLIICVVSMRRRDEDSDKYSGDTVSDTLFNVVAASQQQQRINQDQRAVQPCERSVSYKSLQTILPLKSPAVSHTLHTNQDNTDTVYDAPCKTSPTSNSSVCSIFSGSESHYRHRYHHHHYNRVLSSAQPYETPLSSRQNLFTSNSTLNTTTGSEVFVTKTAPVHPQLVPPGTMTLDRLRRVKLKKPLPIVKPNALLTAEKPATQLQVPEKRSGEKPTLAVSDRQSKPRAPTPELTNDNMEGSTQDEGYCTARHPVRLLQQDNIYTDISSSQDMYCSPPEDEKDIMETIKRMNIPNIPRQDIQVISHIGNGEFGSVAKAYWKHKSGEVVEVAVKSVPLLEYSNNSEDRVRLLQEAVMMGQFRHPNVVQLHGIATAGTSFMLVLGYLAKGDLRTHLLQMNRETLLSSTNKLLTSYSQQVALGMHYLASKGFVHRDLAARNIFVSESNTCKVGDFGMSRDLANAPYYISRGGKIPVRWTAPEAMYYHKYSSASDVWSYGCVLYEIWSLGRLPFKKFANAQVLERLDSGYRLPPPPGAPRAIYELMIQTWHPNPRRRPEFRHILVQLVQDEASLLHIPVRDASTSQQASQLGSPLSAGEYMYSDLQKAYFKTHSPPEEEEQYDSLIGRKYVLSFPTCSADIDDLYGDHRKKSYRSPSDTESEET